MRKTVLLLFAATLAASAAAAQAPAYPCQPSEEVQAALDQATQVSRSLPFEQRIAPLRELVRQYPDNIFVHHAYQDAFRQVPFHLEEMDRAQALYDGMKDRTLAKYLTARLLIGRRLKKSATLFLETLHERPDFAWPHLGIAEIASQPQNLKPALVLSEMDAFARACPDAPERFLVLPSTNDAKELQAGIGKLARLLAQDPLPARLIPYYPRLWAAEKKLTGNDSTDAFKALVERDLDRLRRLPPVPSRQWFEVLHTGFSLVGDKAGLAWLSKTVEEKFPRSDLAFLAVYQQWLAGHPPPNGAATKDEVAKYQYGLFQQAGEWLKTWPDQPEALVARWSSYSQLPAFSKTDIPSLMDTVRKLVNDHPDVYFSSPPRK